MEQGKCAGRNIHQHSCRCSSPGQHSCTNTSWCHGQCMTSKTSIDAAGRVHDMPCSWCGWGGSPKPVGDGDHHVHEGPLRHHPAVLVKDDGQPLATQHLGLCQQGLCSLAGSQGQLVRGKSVWGLVLAVHGIVEAEQHLQGWLAAWHTAQSV